MVELGPEVWLLASTKGKASEQRPRDPLRPLRQRHGKQREMKCQKRPDGESEGWEEKPKYVMPLISRKTLIMNCDVSL